MRIRLLGSEAALSTSTGNTFNNATLVRLVNPTTGAVVVTLNENDEATMSFRYDIIEKEPSTDQYDTPEFHEYAGNILVTLIIQALNNYEEKNT